MASRLWLGYLLLGADLFLACSIVYSIHRTAQYCIKHGSRVFNKSAEWSWMEGLPCLYRGPRAQSAHGIMDSLECACVESGECAVDN